MAEGRTIIDLHEIGNLDKQIDVLLSCKPLPESQIKVLCDKVSQICCIGQQHAQVYNWSRLLLYRRL